MGVYIKGMKMPKDREIYLRIDEKGEVYVYGSYPTELYKAVPVPQHGRLIDADTFENFIRKDWDKNDHWIADVVYSRPTIIPAEGNEDGSGQT